ncbi:MAG: response regulator [Rhodoferax sp.]
MRILIVEDDALLGAGLRAALDKSGFVVNWLRDGASVLALQESLDYDAMVLDIGLPDISGLELLGKLRALGITLPVLVLTARDATRDKVVSLDQGADDFLGKTADMEELVARLRALIRRAGRGGGALSVGGIKLDLDSHTVTKDGKLVKVSRREFSILRALLEAAGRVLTRAQLEQSLYGWSDGVESNAVEVHIHHLRQKLGASALTTVRGIGYTIGRPQ